MTKYNGVELSQKWWSLKLINGNFNAALWSLLFYIFVHSEFKYFHNLKAPTRMLQEHFLYFPKPLFK